MKQNQVKNELEEWKVTHSEQWHQHWPINGCWPVPTVMDSKQRNISNLERPVTYVGVNCT